MWFLTGLADGNVGLFVRLHRVMADGIAGVASLGAFLDRGPTVRLPRPQAGEALASGSAVRA